MVAALVAALVAATAAATAGKSRATSALTERRPSGRRFQFLDVQMDRLFRRSVQGPYDIDRVDAHVFARGATGIPPDLHRMLPR